MAIDAHRSLRDAPGADAGPAAPAPFALEIDRGRGEVRAAFTGESPPATLPGPRCLWSRGFIANRRALVRARGLPGDGTDADLVAALARDPGEEPARQVAGSLAWILWEPDARRLTAVRDRAGVHGIFFAADGDRVVVATDVDGVLARLPPRPLDPDAVVAQVLGEPPPPGGTFFTGVHALEPGQALTVELDGAGEGTSVATYWQAVPGPLLRLPTDADYADAFRRLLFEVVADYLPEGAVGLTLSGGLDSGALAAAVRQVAPLTDLVPLTWVAPELPAADEGPLAAAVAKQLDLRPVAIRADLLWPLSGSGEGEGRGVRRRGEPAATYYDEIWAATCAAARRAGAGVVLTGASGDNLFGGNAYSYPDLLLTLRWGELARQLRRHLPRSEMGTWRVVRSMIAAPIARAVLPWLPRLDPPPWLAAAHRARAMEVFRRRRRDGRRFRLLPGRAALLAQLRERRLTQVLRQLDHLAAGRGVELRHPLLDHRLVELAARLPIDQVFRAAERKVIMRNALRGRLPDEVVDLPRKVTPDAVFARGLREREVGQARALLTGMRAAELGFVDETRLSAAYEDYVAGRGNDTRFWNALALERWLRGRDG